MIGAALPDSPGGIAGSVAMLITIIGAVVALLKWQGDDAHQVVGSAIELSKALRDEIRVCRDEIAELRQDSDVRERAMRELVRQLGVTEAKLNHAERLCTDLTKVTEQLHVQVSQLERRKLPRNGTDA